MSDYRVEQGNWQNEPAMILRDLSSGSEAMVIPGIGANCVGWSITHAGQRLEVMETPTSPDDLRSHRYRAGMPVLWPFPGRVRDARYTFNGVEYHLPPTDKGGIHHIHGIVVEAPWRVGDYGSSADGARLALEIGPEDIAEDMRAGFPFNFGLTLTFTLTGRRLSIDLRVENRQASGEMPFGYGLHPYFRAPLIPTSATPDRPSCLVLIPASQQWPTDSGLPAGPAQPVSPAMDFRQWKAIGTELYDDMYTGSSYEAGLTVAGYRDPGAGLEVQVRADTSFKDWVFFTHPTHPSLCLEPYTCPPNAINMKAEGIPGDNLIILPAGGQWTGRVVLEVL